MEIKDYIEEFNAGLKKWNLLIGLIVILLLLILIVATFKNFEKQNQIIETGGFIEGDIKCVCSQDAWDECARRFLKDDTLIKLYFNNSINNSG